MMVYSVNEHFVDALCVQMKTNTTTMLLFMQIYRLISASGLKSAPGFMEMVSEWSCLGYGLATCRA